MSPDQLTGQPTDGPVLDGIWRSHYWYVSTTRGHTERRHHVVVREDGARVRVDSVAGSNDSPFVMRLDRAGSILTGTWIEQTAADGRYRGARYHGAVQLVVDPTFRTAVGMWVGYDKAYVVNSGSWTLTFVAADLGAPSVAAFSTPA